MRTLLAVLAAAALLTLGAPALQAASSPLPGAVQSLSDDAVAYAKKGGWKGGWKGFKRGHAYGHRKFRRRGPPPWAPAHGLRRKRGY